MHHKLAVGVPYWYPLTGCELRCSNLSLSHPLAGFGDMYCMLVYARRCVQNISITAQHCVYTATIAEASDQMPTFFGTHALRQACI